MFGFTKTGHLYRRARSSRICMRRFRLFLAQRAEESRFDSLVFRAMLTRWD